MPVNTSSDDYVPDKVRLDTELVPRSLLTGSERIAPPTDSAATVRVFKADNSTEVLSVDTLSNRLNITNLQVGVVSTLSSGTNNLDFSYYFSDAAGPRINFRKSRGTLAAPLNLAAGDEIAAFYPVFRSNNLWGGAIWLRWLYSGDGTTNLSELSIGGVIEVKSSGGIRFVPRSSSPSLPEEGEVYYDSSLKKLRCWDGLTWRDCW